MKRNLFEVIQSWFVAPRGNDNALTRLGEVQSMFRDVEARLIDILHNSALITTGRVQLIGLQDVKTKLGPQWPEKQTRVHEALSTIVKRRLTPRDVFFPRSDEEYLIVFASLGLEAAQMVCGGIIQELKEQLFGEEGMGGVTVKTAVGVIDGQLIFEAKALDDVLAGFKDVTAGPDSSVVPPLLSHAGAVEPVAKWQTTMANPSGKQAALDGFEIVYLPMWDSKQEVLSTYVVSPARTDSSGRPKDAYGLITDPDLIRLIDKALLNDAITTVTELFANNFRMMICVPVHYESVSTKALRFEYVRSCSVIPEQIRRYFIFACESFPAGTPSSKLALIAGALKPYCRFVAANVSAQIRNFGDYVESGISIVGCRLPAASLSDMSRHLIEFVRNAHRSGLLSAILNADDLDICKMAHAADVGFLTGRSIGRFSDVPNHMIKLPWKDIKKGHVPSS